MAEKKRLTQLRIDALWSGSTGTHTGAAATTSASVHAHSGDSETARVVSQPPQDWPRGVTYITSFIGSDIVHFGGESAYSPCACTSECRFGTCTNSESYVICSAGCCNFTGLCGNGLNYSEANLQLVQSTPIPGYGVRSSIPIDSGVIIGEYFGEFVLHAKNTRVKNNGYLLKLKEPPGVRGFDAYIDARNQGNFTRFLNHSCNAAARFEEVSRGSYHTIVVVTQREIKAGEQISVDYGDNLWFICRCCDEHCRHRGIEVTDLTEDDEDVDAV